jgi:tetratricopeptide (TPR) repeat protein
MPPPQKNHRVLRSHRVLRAKLPRSNQFTDTDTGTDNFLWKLTSFMADFCANKGSRIAFTNLISSQRAPPRRPFRVLMRGLSVRVMVPGLLGIASLFLHAAEVNLPVLRKQLQTAEEASDSPAIVELSRRIVEADPNDSETWETLATKQLEIEDLDRCAATLDTWQARVRPRPKIIDDLRGDLALARKDSKSAERYWRLYVAADPEATDTLEKLAKLSESAERWQEAVDWRTRSLGESQTVTGLVARADDYLELRAWDKAFADINKANAIDATDEAVKNVLPKFELLKKFVPQITILDARIAKSPATPLLWLDRARLFTLGDRPHLALKDSEHSMNLAPGMMRARVQAGEALLDLGRVDEAADLGVSNNLKRDKNNHLPDEALRALGAADDSILKSPGQAEPLVIRAKALRQINQYNLALADAQAAIKLDPVSASAHFQAAHAEDSLGRAREAITHAEKATLLNPGDPVSWYYRGLLEAQRANFDLAIQCQSRSLAIRESSVALLEREKCERRIGRIAEAELDAQRLKQLPTPQE